MAKPLLPDDLWKSIEPLLPPEPPKPKGGRPRVPGRAALTKRRIKVQIARKGIDSSEKLGRHRWVVERTLAWLGHYRRLRVRYEKRKDIHEAFLQIGCALITWNAVQRYC